MASKGYYSIGDMSMTEEEWLTIDPVLGYSEVAYVTDKKKTKHGDGVSKFSELSYDNGEDVSSGTTLADYGITDAYTKDEINSKFGGVFNYKGTIDIGEINNIGATPEVGDVYNIVTSNPHSPTNESFKFDTESTGETPSNNELHNIEDYDSNSKYTKFPFEIGLYLLILSWDIKSGSKVYIYNKETGTGENNIIYLMSTTPSLWTDLSGSIYIKDNDSKYIGKKYTITFDFPVKNGDNIAYTEYGWDRFSSYINMNEIYDRLSNKADRQTDSGGFAAGAHAASSAGGGAIGDSAITNKGGAVGNRAFANDGGAVGEGTVAGDGFAGGKGAVLNADEDDPEADPDTWEPAKDKGGAVGASANSYDGGSVGYKAHSYRGGAVGYKTHTNDGAAMGYKANSNDGAAIGWETNANNGGSVGNSATTIDGGAVGSGADSTHGGSVGQSAVSNDGGAVGFEAVAGDGFAGGKEAKTWTINSNGAYSDINAVQLGTGTNSNEFTAQFYDYQLLADDAKTKSATDGSKYLKDVGKLSKLTTTDKTSIVSAINELKSNGIKEITVDYSNMDLSDIKSRGLYHIIYPGDNSPDEYMMVTEVPGKEVYFQIVFGNSIRFRNTNNSSSSWSDWVTDINSADLSRYLGYLGDLTTNSKSNVVSAINELKNSKLEMINIDGTNLGQFELTDWSKPFIVNICNIDGNVPVPKLRIKPSNIEITSVHDTLYTHTFNFYFDSIPYTENIYVSVDAVNTTNGQITTYSKTCNAVKNADNKYVVSFSIDPIANNIALANTEGYYADFVVISNPLSTGDIYLVYFNEEFKHIKLQSSGKFTTNGGFFAGEGAVLNAEEDNPDAEEWEIAKDKGGAIGADASSYDGGAIGYHAHSRKGGSVGYNAETSDGGAVGSDAKATDGGAIGVHAKTSCGGAIGSDSNSNDGGAIGFFADTQDGGAVGNDAKATDGGAVGSGAVTSNGFAGGKEAKTQDSKINGIDAVQLGTGTNGNEFTAQFYDYQLLANDATTKSATDGSKYLKDVGKLSKLSTTNKTDIVSAINVITNNTTIISNSNGGFAAGKDATVSEIVETGGVAIGNKANTQDGVALGNGARCANDGGVAIGNKANARYDGVAIGKNALTSNGVSIGEGAHNELGVAIGKGALIPISSGIAIGDGAIVLCEHDPAEAIQIGAGTNENDYTARIYDYQLLADDATTKSATDGSKYLKDVGKLNNLTTTNKTDIVSAINELVSNGIKVEEVPDALVWDDMKTTGLYYLKHDNSISPVYLMVIGSPDTDKCYQTLFNEGKISSRSYSSGSWSEWVEYATVPTIENIYDNSDNSPITINITDKREFRYNGGNISTLTVTLPSSVLNYDFKSKLIFKSGSTATVFANQPENLKLMGDDCDNALFTPVANKKYIIDINYDGINFYGIVRSYAI